MKIVVITGTEVKGCTYQIKEAFLSPLREAYEIVEYYLPKDMPHTCIGCKLCFLKDENLCPHAIYVKPIWSDMMEADLIVMTSPVYGLGISGALKSLLDHLCVHWMVHRPKAIMFSKRGVVLTNCIGPSFMARKSQRDAVNALSWLGISKIERVGIGLLEGVIWEELSAGRRERIVSKARKAGEKYITMKPAKKSIKTGLKFWMCKNMQQAVLRKMDEPTADNAHWVKEGWIKRR
jgi:hypothetical protein